MSKIQALTIISLAFSSMSFAFSLGLEEGEGNRPTYTIPSGLPKVPNIGSETPPRLPITIQNPNGSSTTTILDPATNKPLISTTTNAQNQVTSETMYDATTGKPLENQTVNPNGTITRTSFNSITGAKTESIYKGTQILPQSPSSNKPSIP